MSSAAQPAPVKTRTQSDTRVVQGLEWGVVAAYLLAILSQYPMLTLYAESLMAEPHYHSALFAVAATIAVAVLRWPRGQAVQLQQSITSNVLLMLALVAVVFSIMFVMPWMSALSVMLIVTSFLARVPDVETKGSLWYAALPMFVFLQLPFGWDRSLVTSLQSYSAGYTSRLLDLFGVGHYMDGTVLEVPNMQKFGIEQACSGVQSFFTLVLVAVVYSVFNRQVKAPPKGVAILSFLGGIIFLMIRKIPMATAGVEMPAFWSGILFILAISLMLFAFIGFRTTLLVMSAVFWAIFMNTIRIMSIPIAMRFFELDLSEGTNHVLLGYTSLIMGIVLILSTDQLIMFLFGPVQDANESGKFGRVLGKIWNSLIPFASTNESSRGRRGARSRQPIAPAMQKVLWGFAIIMIGAGIWQFTDVRACQREAAEARAEGRDGKKIRAFDSNVTVEFSEGDVSRQIDNWTLVGFNTDVRSRGSDFGERSDIWHFQSPNCSAVASLDQTFPGWHELTTCYKNTGWKVISRRAISTAEALGSDKSDGDQEGNWDMIEVQMQKSTGERGYLLFSHLDSFGKGLEVPKQWGTVNGFITRVMNRLSHRIRATLVQGEAYQVQVFIESFNDFDPEVIAEARKRYVKIRKEIQSKFLDKLSAPEP